MKITDITKATLAYRREQRDMTKAGYEYLGEGGGKIWEIYRGSRVGMKIIDAKISRNGMFVWIKIGGLTAHEQYMEDRRIEQESSIIGTA